MRIQDNLSTPIARYRRFLTREEEVEIRVARGIKLLNENMPRWRTLIDVGKLNICDAHNCVLGQCYGSYSAGARALGLTEVDDDHYYGFNARDEEGYILTESAWCRHIETGPTFVSRAPG